MTHEFWDIVRDVASGTIVFLLGLLFKRHMARHDAEKQAEKDWRERVDNYITRGERRRYPRGTTQGKANGVHNDDSSARGDVSRIRKPRPPDEE